MPPHGEGWRGRKNVLCVIKCNAKTRGRGRNNERKGNVISSSQNQEGVIVANLHPLSPGACSWCSVRQTRDNIPPLPPLVGRWLCTSSDPFGVIWPKLESIAQRARSRGQDGYSLVRGSQDSGLSPSFLGRERKKTHVVFYSRSSHYARH